MHLHRKQVKFKEDDIQLYNELGDEMKAHNFPTLEVSSAVSYYTRPCIEIRKMYFRLGYQNMLHI